MFFKKKPSVKKSAKKFDNLITGIIIGGAIGGVFGIYRHNKAKEAIDKSDIMEHPEVKKVNEKGGKIARRALALLGRGLVKIIDIFDSKK